MIEVKSYFQAGDTWLVDYIDAFAGGCCGVPKRHTIKIKQSKKPTQKQVENAINKSKGQDV